MPFKPIHIRRQKFNIDIVICIDASGGMSPLINEIKCMASSFGSRIVERFEEIGKEIEKLRIRFVIFRDFNADTNALYESQFFSIPEDQELFQAFVHCIEAIGGGDEPENALEALAVAMNSDWSDSESIDPSIRQRHVIMLFTDAGAIELEDSCRDHEQYPSNMPTDFIGLEGWWLNGPPNGKLRDSAKRLILFAPPDVEPWDKLQCWNGTLLSKVDRAGCCHEVTMELIIDSIVYSTYPLFHC